MVAIRRALAVSLHDVHMSFFRQIAGFFLKRQSFKATARSSSPQGTRAGGERWFAAGLTEGCYRQSAATRYCSVGVGQGSIPQPAHRAEVDGKITVPPELP